MTQASKETTSNQGILSETAVVQSNENSAQPVKSNIEAKLTPKANAVQPTQLCQSAQLTHKELKEIILSKVRTDLLDIEKALHDNLSPHLDLVLKIASHLLFSGGKRLRPLLMLLSSRLCDYQGNLAIKFSTIFEYLHAATLLHDDVVDEAHMRRGKMAAHSLWSVPEVVLTGDFLLARSLSLAAETGLPAIIGVMAGITEDMSQGEIDQMAQKRRLDLTEAQYMTIIQRKTAVLIQGACRSGAIIACASKEKEDALDLYGYHLGMAFQMADDLLDYTGDIKTLGKNPGADIREGKLTLPLIHALSVASEEDRKTMEYIIKNSCSDSRDTDSDSTQKDRTYIEELKVCKDKGLQNTLSALPSGTGADWFGVILEKLNQYNSIEYTEKKAQTHVLLAKKQLEIFDNCDAKEIMIMLADYSVARKM